jgi:hypothetical protein
MSGYLRDMIHQDARIIRYVSLRNKIRIYKTGSAMTYNKSDKSNKSGKNHHQINHHSVKSTEMTILRRVTGNALRDEIRDICEIQDIIR